MALTRIVTAVDLLGDDPERPIASMRRIGGGRWRVHPAPEGGDDTFDTYEDALAAVEGKPKRAPRKAKT